MLRRRKLRLLDVLWTVGDVADRCGVDSWSTKAGRSGRLCDKLNRLIRDLTLGESTTLEEQLLSTETDELKVIADVCLLGCEVLLLGRADVDGWEEDVAREVAAEVDLFTVPLISPLNEVTMLFLAEATVVEMYDDELVDDLDGPRPGLGLGLMGMSVGFRDRRTGAANDADELPK